MSEPVLKIENVVKSYGSFRAVDSVSLAVDKGEALALLGHNGAGKTTLFKLALGLIQPSFGQVTLACEKTSIGYLPENINFYDQMSGYETLSYYARLKKATSKQVENLLEQVGLAPFKNRRVRNYSKGMRQRLGFAQALLGQPQILFLDEPTAGLDPVGREEFFDVIKQLNDEGTAVIFSSHVLRELENKAENIAIMHSGHLIAHDSLENLRECMDKPAHISLKLCDAKKREHWEKALSSFGGGEFELLKRGNKMLFLSCPISVKQKLISFIVNSNLSFEDMNILPASLSDVYVDICQKQNLENETEKVAA